MTEQQKEYNRLILSKTIEDNIDLCDVFIEAYTELIKKHHYDPITGAEEADAKILLQMMMSKLIHIKKLIEGVGYKDKSGNTILNEIIDPTIISSLVRNLFETACAFHLIYVSPTSKEDSLVVYRLWVSAGLKYRQRFTSSLISTSNKKKAKEEQDEIDELEKQIHASNTYKRLNTRNAGKIDTKIKEKDYRIVIDGNNVKFKNWHEIPQEMGCKKDFFENIYTYFSLYSHPSNVSVFQFAEMFRKSDPAYEGKVVFNLRFCFSMASIFLSDYLKVFPTNQITFENLPIVNQAICNFHNRVIRGNHYSINDAHESI